MPCSVVYLALKMGELKMVVIQHVGPSLRNRVNDMHESGGHIATDFCLEIEILHSIGL